MKKAKIHFDDVFCQQTEEHGIPRKVLVRYARQLRNRPNLGKPVVSGIEAFREWKVHIRPYGWFRLGYMWSEELGDIDLSYIETFDPAEPPEPLDKTGNGILERMILLAKLAAMVIRIVKEFLSISS